MTDHLQEPTFSETDFASRNPDGFSAVKEAIDSARLKRALAGTGEELREASLLLQAALDRKDAERRVAIERFRREKDEAHAAIAELGSAVNTTRRDGIHQAEMDAAMQNLADRYKAKDFAAVLTGAAALRRRLDEAQRRPQLATGRSATSHFYEGVRLESTGNTRDAVAAYRRCIDINPRHIQALSRLDRLAGRGASAAAGLR